VYAASGATVALSSQDVAETLVATHVGDETLSPAHGFPARLVVPSRRGYQWLKWVEKVVVS
jgi:DMSO/TMAO reductase YedYZ molybdopterin-dependent catalytic subunit